jgi:nitroreductase
MDTNVPTPQELKLFLATRKSCRRYQPREVDAETIRALVEIAAHIPSGGNRHAHLFTVLARGATRDRLMRELTRIYRGRSRLLNSPVLRVLVRPFVGPFTREFLRDREYAARMRSLLAQLEAGEDPVFHGAPAAIVIHSRELIPTPKEDAVIAGFALSLAAHSMGMGSCFVTLAQNALNASARCRAVLGLSPREKVHAVVVIGYPAAPSAKLPAESAPRDSAAFKAPREVRFA